jgi:3-isopropylmalate dehydrogenase
MDRIAIIPGDGIGPEITAQLIRVLQAIQERSGLELQLVEFDLGAERYLKSGEALPDALIGEFRQDFCAIFIGALGDPRIPNMIHAQEILGKLRGQLDLFVHICPVKLLHERYCPLKDKQSEDVDFVVFWDNNEGGMPGFSGAYGAGTADEVCFRQLISTRRGVERFLRHAFEYGRLRGLRRLTLSHRNATHVWEDNLLQRIFEEIRSAYPEIECLELPIGALMAKLLKSPEIFDVIVTTNLYGEAIADLGAQLQGGLGLGAGGDLHPGKLSLFMPAGGGRRRVGQNAANPLGAILAGALMLQHLGLQQEADWVQCAVKNALDSGNVTYDLGGRLETQQVADFVAQQIRKGAC